MRRIVRFVSLESDARFPADFSPEARALVDALLEPKPEKRLGSGDEGIAALELELEAEPGGESSWAAPGAVRRM